jgi:hypothetical protein
MQIRPASLRDLSAMVDIAVESVARNPLPVNIDRQAMKETVRVAITSPAHFAWVGEHDGLVEAALGAVVQPSFWFRGGQASVLLYYTRRAGLGLALMREFARWVKSRPMIKVAVFELEPESDPRLVKALERMGFTRQSTNCSYVRTV